MLAPVANVHERAIAASPEQVGALLETLATADDRIWPTDRWPAMRFAGGLREGAVGGHGPIRYALVEHRPGRRVRFRFLAPRGLRGDHWFEVIPSDDGRTLLRHGLVAHPAGAMRWQWPLLWRPLHDALIEDALARAAGEGGGVPRWSLRVRLLRRLARGL